MVCFSLLSFYVVIRPARVISSVSPKEFGLNYEVVNLTTSDQVNIKGWFIPSKKSNGKTIILLHGYPADKGDILPTRVFLHDDYNLLLIDFRYFGESGGNYSSIGYDEARDVQAAIEYLHKRGINQIGIWGLSLGGAVALLGAYDSHKIKAIVAEAPFARLDWMAQDYYTIPGVKFVMAKLLSFWARLMLGIDIHTVNPVEMVSKTTIPTLLIYSKDDEVIPYKHAEAMQEASQYNAKVEIVIFDEGRHGESSMKRQKTILDFFNHEWGQAAN